MSRGEVIAAAVVLVLVLVLIVVLIDAARGQDVSWRMSYTTRRQRRRQARHVADLSQDNGEDDDDG
jgi:hypothetical protein